VTVSSAFQADAAVTLAASTTTTSAALPASNSTTLCISNSTTAVAFLAVGGAGTVATITSPIVVLPGQRFLAEIGPVPTVVACILSAGSGAVYVVRGSGISTN
jgi:hypothetical protein